MIKMINNKNAQAVAGEYVLVFFIVMGVISGMSTYFKRTIQARIYDSRAAMVDIINAQTGTYFNGNLYIHYEPYYTNVESEVYRSMDSRTTLAEGGTTGIYRKEVDDMSRITSWSITKPPKEADEEYD